MFFHNIKHNVIIFLCIFLIVSGCQKEKEKIIVENNEIIEIQSKNNKTLVTKNYPTNKITKKEITPNDDNVSENLKNDNVVFEFKNERLLQGRNFPKNLELNKTNKALSAVLKMFKKNLSSNSTELQLEYNDSSTGVNKYFLRQVKFQNTKTF